MRSASNPADTFPLLPTSRVHQSIAHARRLKRKAESAEKIASQALNASGASRIRPIVRVLSLVRLFGVCSASCRIPGTNCVCVFSASGFR